MCENIPYYSLLTKYLPIFYVLLTVHVDILCNEDQLYALFILNLFLLTTWSFDEIN
jgi:hypothetical protein